MDAIDIINFARKPVPIREVWSLKVTTVSTNFMPITKTAYRKIDTPKEELIDDLDSMITGRLQTILGLAHNIQIGGAGFTDAGYVFWLMEYDSSIDEVGPKGVTLNEALQTIWNDMGINCSITNFNTNTIFEIMPKSLPKKNRLPKSHKMRGTIKGGEAETALFVKCVRVKVK